MAFYSPNQPSIGRCTCLDPWCATIPRPWCPQHPDGLPKVPHPKISLLEELTVVPPREPEPTKEYLAGFKDGVAAALRLQGEK